MAIAITRRLFTVDEYYRMAEAGILNEDDRVELIDGEIVEMAPIGPEHASIVARLNNLLVTGAGGAAIVWPQNPVRLSNITEPQPDLALLRWREDFYRRGHPQADDVIVVIEVADSSLAYDRDVKAALYARAGIPEFWLVDVNQRRVTIFRGPAPDSYRTVIEAQGADSISPVAFPQIQLGIDQVFGPAGGP
jgi:Uma2 family endonuclease